MAKARPVVRHVQGTSWLTSFVMEIISIIIAVLLALAVNEWREARSNAKIADQALRSIRDEILENKRMFEIILPQHLALLDTLIDVDAKIHRGELSEEEDRADLKFVPLFVQNTAWQTALATQALLHMPYETVKVLSEIYTFQGSYTNVTDHFIKAVFDINNNRDDLKAAQRKFAISALQTFVTYEKAMPQFYDKALNITINKHKAISAADTTTTD